LRFGQGPHRDGDVDWPARPRPQQGAGHMTGGQASCPPGASAPGSSPGAPRHHRADACLGDAAPFHPWSLSPSPL